jgi:hypothetical protein
MVYGFFLHNYMIKNSAELFKYILPPFIFMDKQIISHICVRVITRVEQYWAIKQ